MIPKEGLSLLQQSNGCGYTFLQKGCVQFHPSVMQHAISLTSSHPHKEPKPPVDDYFTKADAAEIEEQVCWERPSPDPQDCRKYSIGMLNQNISGITHSLQRISSKPVHGIDLDNCEPSKWQHFKTAIHAFSSNFSKFDITKPCALCGSPGHTFDNSPEVTNPKLS